MPTSRLCRSHLHLDSTVLSLGQCQWHSVPLCCDGLLPPPLPWAAAAAAQLHPRRRRRNRRCWRRRCNPTPAVDVGGATSAGVRADPGPVAPPRSGLNIKQLEPCNPNPCAAAAFQARFCCGPARELSVSLITSYDIYIPDSAVICQDYELQICMSYVRYIPYI